jgi:hypothetical protein
MVKAVRQTRSTVGFVGWRTNLVPAQEPVRKDRGPPLGTLGHTCGTDWARSSQCLCTAHRSEGYEPCPRSCRCRERYW